MSDRCRERIAPLGPDLIALVLLASISSPAEADDRRWRIFEQPDSAMLAASHTDEGSDDLGSQYFRCEGKAGTITVAGMAKQKVLDAMADVIRSNGYPIVNSGSGEAGLLNMSFNEMNEGWQYNFDIQATAPAFEEFRRTGRFAFKIGNAVIREEFKVGLENVGKFLELCKPPSKKQ